MHGTPGQNNFSGAKKAQNGSHRAAPFQGREKRKRRRRRRIEDLAETDCWKDFSIADFFRRGFGGGGSHLGTQRLNICPLRHETVCIEHVCGRQIERE